tara:strand:+ start:2421 stop:3188 length:768 start_codon:yes stop_codon:yes gene_type:complete
MNSILRADHGKKHTGKYCALVRVSTDKQDVENQIFAIKQYLNGGDHHVEWFKEEAISGRTAWEERPVLMDAIKYCRKNKATLIVYSLSRLGRRRGDVLKFFDDVVQQGKIKLVVVDNPVLDETTVGFMAVMQQHEAQVISERTKTALARIKHDIKTHGSHISRSGKKITKLGTGMTKQAQKKGALSNKAKADLLADNLMPNIQRGLDMGWSYRDIAMDFNKRGYKTARGGEWHGSTIRNMYLRKVVAETERKRIK